MAKVDDLLQRWTKQIVLTIVARLTHGFPPTANLPSKESRSAEIRNPKTQENRDPPRLSCKIEYLLNPNHTDTSITSEFFTDDLLNDIRPTRFYWADMCRSNFCPTTSVDKL
jgi:hypothetical protein